MAGLVSYEALHRSLPGLTRQSKRHRRLSDAQEFWICSSSWMRGSSPRMTPHVDVMPPGWSRLQSEASIDGSRVSAPGDHNRKLSAIFADARNWPQRVGLFAR